MRDIFVNIKNHPLHIYPESLRPTGPLWTSPAGPELLHSLGLDGVGGEHRLPGAQETHCVTLEGPC